MIRARETHFDFFSIHSFQPKPKIGPKGMSSGKFSGKSEVLTYRQFFAHRWQAFIVENFESPSHAAFAFKVDPSTAQNWFEGLNAPQGWVVGKAISDPELQGSILQHFASEQST